MFGKPFILLEIALENFALIAAYRTNNLLGISMPIKLTCDCKLICIELNILRIDCIEITLTRAQVINSIEQIGFSRTIVAEKTIHSFRQL
jgi:hypothetical protein